MLVGAFLSFLTCIVMSCQYILVLREIGMNIRICHVILLIKELWFGVVAERFELPLQNYAV